MNYDQKAVKIKGRAYAQTALLIPADDVGMIRLIEKAYTAGYRQRILDVKTEGKDVFKANRKELRKLEKDIEKAKAKAREKAKKECERVIASRKATILKLRTEIKSLQSDRLRALGLTGRKKKEDKK